MIDRLRDLTPHIAGSFLFGQPSYLVMHGTRSGTDNTIREEFDGNRAYVVTNTKGYSWHVTVGEDAYSVHLPMDKWGWHANEDSQRSLGVEFAQPTVNHTINEAQVRAFCAWFKAEVLPVYPFFNLAAEGKMRMHSELLSGQRQGKTDVYPLGSARWPVLREQIIEQLGGVGQPGTGGGPHDHLTPPNGLVDPNQVLEAYQQRLDVSAKVLLGAPLYRGVVRGRSHWGEDAIHVLRLERGLLGVVNGTVVNLTGHALDDWQTDHADLIQRF